MRGGAPKSVSQILNTLETGSVLEGQLSRSRVWENWPRLTGGELALHTRPAGFKDRILYIEAESAVWMHKFAFSKSRIINRINQLAGKDLIRDVFCWLPDDVWSGDPQDNA